MPRHRIITIAITLGAGIALAIFLAVFQNRWRDEQSLAATQAQAATLRPTRIAMKWTFAGTMAPYFAALKNGIFRDHKLEVELSPGGNKSPSIRQVILNRADFGITGAHELALARSHDQPLVSIAVIFKTSPTCIASFEEANLTKPKDLVGKTVEMSIGDNSEFEYLAMLRRNGVDPKQVNTVRWQYNYVKLLSGQSDAAVVYENDQAITLAKERTLRLICPHDFEVTPYADVLFTTESLIDNDPDFVRDVVFAILEAWEWAERNTAHTVDLFLKDPRVAMLDLDSSVQVAILKKSLEFVKGPDAGVDTGEHINLIGVQNTDRWQETISLLRDFGEVQKLPTPESCFTNKWTRMHQYQNAPPQ